MGKIRLLSEGIIGKIAAGEVVERPSAAIKELVENSIDAGASAVSVEIRDGGLEYIRVTDNGSGIDESDIRLAFERHATSKITKETDLNAIATLGFRGEALASIAAVSKMTVITRTADRDTGLKVANQGGTILSIEETAYPVGTSIIVTDLFYNTPVRRGFMKKPQAEAAQVNELMMHLILSRPDISFRHTSNGKTVYHSAGDGRLSSAVHSVYGLEALKSMKEVSGHANGLLAKGYVGIGELARGNRNNECFFINRRMMFSSVLSGALETACRERVMIGKYPICVLHLQIPYEAVDVNVHPNKLEVRFRDEAQVSDALTTLVLEALREKDAFEQPVPMPLVRAPKEEPDGAVMREAPARPLQDPNPVQVTVSKTLPEAARAIRTEPVKETPFSSAALARNDAPVPAAMQEAGSAAEGTKPAPTAMREEGPAADGTKPAPTAMRETETASPSPKPAQAPAQQPMGPLAARPAEKAEQTESFTKNEPKPIKVFGALFDTYILIEYADQLLLVDQHAVHERLLFDKMMKEFVDHGTVASQEMLVPRIIPVTRQEQDAIEENREMLESIGLSLETFGEHDLAIRAVPMVLGAPESVDFVREVIEELENGKDPGFERKRAMILQTACKHAVKGGERLTEEILRDLVEQMLEKKVTPTCPHGRPLVVSISHRELDRKFKRIQ